MNAHNEPVLSVRRLVTTFGTPRGRVRAVDGLDLDIYAGEVVCLVGESGSGKTVTGLSVMRLIDPPGHVDADRIMFDGRDLLRLEEREMNSVRGRGISMIFQEPRSALNPSRRVGAQIAEALQVHSATPRAEALEQAIALLEQVGIDDARKRARSYPHEMSGGQLQRVMIAIACVCSPRLIIADEPTTALDVTIQAQVIDVLMNMQSQLGSALLFISHDLGVVAEIADRVVVLYAGQVVEEAMVDDLYRDPAHPYTKGLLASVPNVDAPRQRGLPLTAIPGTVPNLLELPSGCRFRDRCDHAHARCDEPPPLVQLDGGRSARCWLHHE
jgi:oligopeptide/dipeptide ABC transporter ATP-binding protein